VLEHDVAPGGVVPAKKHARVELVIKRKEKSVALLCMPRGEEVRGSSPVEGVGEELLAAGAGHDGAALAGDVGEVGLDDEVAVALVEDEPVGAAGTAPPRETECHQTVAPWKSSAISSLWSMLRRKRSEPRAASSARSDLARVAHWALR
jgi:hypothetical protein